ncbi:DinB family protein [Pedobacter sp. SYSU D00535]|uniref:DinB family protein n=1 Tax=Pedobacter sp. SYSU D00535 TaxID=2810308 RepID=UPI001A9797A0|nr:DinB family protein [Pedobacter sp. SYSU D00535]
MKELKKSELLDQLKARVNGHVQQTEASFRKQRAQLLLKPSPTGGWSVTQCLDHLNSYGDYYLPKIGAALNRKEANPGLNYTSGWLGDYFTRMMEPSDKKYKAFKGHVPAPHLDAHLVVEEFIRQQQTLLQYLQEAKGSDLNYRIPISISKFVRLKLGDTFRFLIAHNERHLQQALKNLN